MAKPEKVETVTEVVAVIPRIDPSEQAEIDGDPAFEAKLVEGSLPADKHAVWVHSSAIQEYKGHGYTEARAGEDGVEMLCGQGFDKGAVMTFRDHTLMLRDRGRHERVNLAERKRNREFRSHAIKKANGTVYVNNPGDGPRQMVRR